MADGNRLTATPLGALIIRTTVASVVIGASVSGCQQDCIKGDSVVGLEMPPTSFVLDRFCVDDQCLSASQRQPPADGPEAGAPRSIFYALPVSDQPDTYDYEIELTAPDGTRHVHDGVVETTGNLMGGENCKPITVNAVLYIDDNGDVTTNNVRR
jgi:hypothetical protein